MKKYQIYIDVSTNSEWENIEVESMIIEAFNYDDAYMKATLEAQELYEYFYVWEVTKEDIIL